MNSPIRISLAVAAALVVGTTFTACNRGGSGGGGGDSLATFNGDRISKDEYYRHLERMGQVRVVTAQGTVPAPVAGGTLGFQALEDMVNRQAVLQVAKDEGVYPTDADIQKELDFQSSKAPDFLKNLTAQGLSIDSIKDDLRVQLAQEKVITKGITVSDEEVDRYIKGNPSKFRQPKLVQMRWIVVKSPDQKKQVDEALSSGQSFKDVAIRYSLAPNARDNEGRYTTPVYDDFPPVLKKLSDGLSEGKTSSWIADSGGASVKFYVESKTPARNVEITPVMKEEVKRSLARLRGQQGSDFQKKLQKKVLAAKIDIPNAPLAKRWSEAVDKTKKDQASAQANSSTSTASAQ
ncbi:hypothetical protein EON81_22525 [bacterium]|nr:MAG: hypothetical protein EON81_22525 [bacterium]